MATAAAERCAVDLLERLCRSPSVSAEGGVLAETADLVEGLLRDAGFETRQLAVDGGPPAVWGELRGTGERTLLLYNHYDVQPADPLELWETPPFEPAIRDGRLYARGAADNKAQIALRLAALRALGGSPPVTIRWIIEGEEEVGSPHFDELVRGNVELLRADGCLWEGSGFLPDGRPEIVLGVKGVLAVRLDLGLLSGDAHSGSAAVVPSAPWRLVDALTCLKEPAGRIRVAGFYGPVREPTPGELAAVAEQSPTADDDLREAYGVREFVDGVRGEELRRRLSFEPTCNLAGFHTGYGGPGVKTVLPARASAWLDFRLVPGQHPSEVLEQMCSHLDARGFGDVEITKLASAEPAATHSTIRSQPARSWWPSAWRGSAHRSCRRRPEHCRSSPRSSSTWVCPASRHRTTPCTAAARCTRRTNTSGWRTSGQRCATSGRSSRNSARRPAATAPRGG